MVIKLVSRVLLLGLSLGACWTPEVPELRIGINPWPGYEFLYLARQQGLFDSTVVRVRLLEFASLTDARRAYERGQLDGFASTVIEVLQARDHSTRRPVITLVTDYSDGADVVIARRGLADVQALRGHRVGVEVGSLNVYLLALAMERNGASLSDVKLVHLDLLQMADALRRGEVDAVVTYPPASLESLRLPGARALFSSRQVPGEIVDVVSVDSSVLAARGPAVAELRRGFERARLYAVAHPEAAYGVMAAPEGLTAEEFGTALQDGVRLVGLEEQAAFLRAGGTLDSVIARTAKVLFATSQLSRVPSVEGLVWREIPATQSVADTPTVVRRP
jgi:NitT/TauT family transport system substrate-binding protein